MNIVRCELLLRLQLIESAAKVEAAERRFGELGAENVELAAALMHAEGERCLRVLTACGLGVVFT